MKKYIICLFLFATKFNVYVLAKTFEEKMTQKIQYFEKGKTDKIVFQQIRVKEGSALNYKMTSELLDLNQNSAPAMKEVLVVKDGEIIEHSVEQLQTNEAWELRIDGDKLRYQNYKINQGQKFKDDKEIVMDKPANFTNGPMIESFVAKNWTDLSQGQVVKLEFSVLEVSKPMSFQFKKVSEGLRSGQKTVVLEMKPLSVVIRFLLDPIYMEFDLASKKLVYFKGRTPVKFKDGSKFKPFDAEISYADWQ